MDIQLPIRALLSMLSCACLSVSSSAQARTDEQQQPARPATLLPLTDRIPPLARMISGEWRMTMANGLSQFVTWHTGPGEQSLRALTDGMGGNGEPWRSNRVVYWHPHHQQIRTLGMSPYARTVSEGTLGLDDGTLHSVNDLYQQGGIRRRLETRWEFDGPDKYQAKLLETSNAGEVTTLGVWDYVRSLSSSKPGSHLGEAAPEPSPYLDSLQALVGPTWEAKTEWANIQLLHTQSTLEWFPHADYIYARSIALPAPSTKVESTHLLDAYVYHHTGTGALRCLALSNSGGVYEGDLTVLEGGAVQLDVQGYEGDRVQPYIVLFEPQEDGTWRNRIWSLEGADRSLLLDTRHRQSAPK